MNSMIAALETVLEETNNAQERIDTLNDLAWALRRDNMDRAVELSAKAIHLSHDSTHFDPPYYTGIIAGMTSQAAVNLYRSNLEEALKQALESLELADKHEIITPLPRLLYITAAAYLELGDLTNSLIHALRQQTISQELNDKEGMAIGSLSLGTLYVEQGELEYALESYKMGIKAFRELNDSYGVALQLANISQVYNKLEKYEDALTYALQGLDVYRLDPSIHPRLEIITLHEVGKSYMGLQQYETAQSYLEESIAVAERSLYSDVHADALLTLATLHNKLEQPERAIPYAKKAVELASRHPLWVYRGHKVLSDSYRLQYDFEKALDHHIKFHAAKEQVFNEETRKKTHALEVLHHTQKVRREAAHYAILYEAEQSHRHLAEIMNQVGQVLGKTLDLTVVLGHILEQLELLVSFDRGSLLLLQDSILEFVAARGYPDGRAPLQYTIPINIHDKQDIFAQICKNKQPLALTELHKNPYWTRTSELPTPDAWLGVPLIHHDEVVGILSLTRITKKPYTQNEIVLTRAFAAHAASALSNAQLYAQISLMNEHLEDEVRLRTEDLRMANDELRHINRIKTDFIDITAHELRTPVTILKGYGQLLQKDISITSNTNQNYLVEGIVNGASRMHEIVNRMLLMVKIDSNELHIYPEPFIIQVMFSSLIKKLSPALENRDLKIAFTNALTTLPPVEGDENMLKTVFSNVLMNAIKYTPDGGTIHVNGRSWTTPPAPDYPPKGVEITIHDSGIGIAPDNLELIFGKMYQTGAAKLHSSGNTKFKGGGTGLGLAIARGIIEAHNGRIWAESDGYDEENLPGSSFHVVLPLTQPET